MRWVLEFQSRIPQLLQYLTLLTWDFRTALLPSCIICEGFATLFWLSSYSVIVELLTCHELVEKLLRRRVSLL